MRRNRVPNLPAEIVAEIAAMARADSCSYEQEVDRLFRRGMILPKEFSVRDEASTIAELAYLHSEQIDDSDEY